MLKYSYFNNKVGADSVKPTLKTIAEIAGVTPMAVSKALNGHTDISEKTRRRILAISEELGYTPNDIARSLVRKKSNMIGVMFTDLAYPLYVDVFKGIDAEAKSKGYTPFLCDINRDIKNEEIYTKSFLEKRLDGFIIAPTTSDVSHILNLTKDNVPLVFLGSQYNEAMQNYVGNDNIAGGRMAAEHLLSLGHRQIAMIADSNPTRAKQDRIEGYRRAMEAAGLCPLVLTKAEKSPPQQCGYQLLGELVREHPEVTAAFATNDTVALGVMEAAVELGVRIPEDLSLMGYDDLIYASLPNIKLTTVAQPKFEIGVCAVRMLLQMIEGDQAVCGRIDLPPALVERRTCRRLEPRGKGGK